MISRLPHSDISRFSEGKNNYFLIKKSQSEKIEILKVVPQGLEP